MVKKPLTIGAVALATLQPTETVEIIVESKSGDSFSSEIVLQKTFECKNLPLVPIADIVSKVFLGRGRYPIAQGPSEYADTVGGSVTIIGISTRSIHAHFNGTQPSALPGKSQLRSRTAK